MPWQLGVRVFSIKAPSSSIKIICGRCKKKRASLHRDKRFTWDKEYGYWVDGGSLSDWHKIGIIKQRMNHNVWKMCWECYDVLYRRTPHLKNTFIPRSKFFRCTNCAVIEDMLE